MSAEIMSEAEAGELLAACGESGVTAASEAMPDDCTDGELAKLERAGIRFRLRASVPRDLVPADPAAAIPLNVELLVVWPGPDPGLPAEARERRAYGVRRFRQVFDNAPSVRAAIAMAVCRRLAAAGRACR